MQRYRKWIQAAVVLSIASAMLRAEECNETERRLVVSIPDRMLALLVDGEVVRVYRTAVGAPATPSPSGEFKIIHRIDHPFYYAPGKAVPPGGANPLGTRWLGLSLKGYGIHGTNSPRTIGKAASKGCIRLRNEEVEELFEMVSIGDVVELHAERNERVAAVFGPEAGEGRFVMMADRGTARLRQ